MAPDLAHRWTTWLDLLEGHGFAISAVLQPPANNAALETLETVTGQRLTDEIRAFYQLNNGQRTRPSERQVQEGRAAPWPPTAAPVFGFYEFLSTEAAAHAWSIWQSVAEQQGPDGMAEMAEPVTVDEPDKVKREYWIPGWLPFAQDGGGNALAFDLAPEPAGIVGQIIIIGSDEDHRRIFAPSISELLARIASEWADGRFEIETEDEETRYYCLLYTSDAADE